MERNILNKTVKLNIALALMMLLIDKRISVGLLLGCFFFIVYYFLLDWEMRIVMANQNANILTKTIKFMRILVLIIPMLIGYYLNDLILVIFSAIALLDFKLFIYLSAFMKKGG